jgi:hypothetical protein
MKTENETTYYIFSRKPLLLNEWVDGEGQYEIYSCPLRAMFRGRCNLCYKTKIKGEPRPPEQKLNWDRTPANINNIFVVDGYMPIEVIDAGWLMRRFAADLAIAASEPCKDIPGRGDGWTEEFITYLETLDDSWRKENASWYRIGPNQLMRPMVIEEPAYALIDVVLVYNQLMAVNNQQSIARPEFKKRIDTLFDMRRVQRPISKGNGVFAYID